jgi:hypothetical protein
MDFFVTSCKNCDTGLGLVHGVIVYRNGKFLHFDMSKPPASLTLPVSKKCSLCNCNKPEPKGDNYKHWLNTPKNDI